MLLAAIKPGKNCLTDQPGAIGFFFLLLVKLFLCIEIPQIAIYLLLLSLGRIFFKSDRLMATEFFSSY